MPSFEVETYKVSSFLERFPGSTQPTRILELTGRVLAHGIQNKALFSFNPQFDGVWSTSVAGYITDGGFSGLAVVGWFPLAEFQHYYDIVRAERPIFVQYEYRDTGSTTGYLRRVGLNTTDEPTGEGSSESTASISASLASYLSPGGERMMPMPMASDLPVPDR